MSSGIQANQVPTPAAAVEAATMCATLGFWAASVSVCFIISTTFTPLND
jgi:hypothetical protein